MINQKIFYKGGVIMNLNRFFFPTTLFWGEGSTENLEEFINSKNVAIVIGKGSIKKNETFKKIISKLKKNFNVELIEGIGENPKISEVISVLNVVKDKNIKDVIAIGGGSVLDCAKAAITVINEDNPILSLKEKKVVKKSDINFIAIPTTCGTGSEADQYALITDESGDKFSFFTEDSYPGYSFLEPGFLETLPDKWVAGTAIDAFCHSLEGFFSIKSNDLTDVFAIKSMEYILENLGSSDRKDLKKLENLHLASALGGIVISHTGTNLIHAFGYYLTKIKNVPHSFSNSSLLPFYIRYISELSDEKIDFFLGFLTPSDDPYDFIVSFLKENDLPHHLRDVGLKEEEFDEFFNYGFSKPNISAFFKKVKKERIYKKLKEWFLE